jgi:F0F1-type ATP synthase epsilon subunit
MVLADALEPVESLDPDAAARELSELREARATTVDVAEAERQIAEARARLRAARRERGEGF